MHDQSEEIKNLIRIFCKDKLVLDNGCGNLTYTIVALEAGASKVYAVDIKYPSININDNRFKFYKSDAQQLPFMDSLFDVILCIGLIEYVDMDKGIDEMKRVLRPGGTIIFQEKDSRGLKHKLYKFKCKLFNKTAEGSPHKYKLLIKKLEDNFDITDYKETKPKHNFIAVLKNGTDI